MAKSPLSRGSKQVKLRSNLSKVVPLALKIPIRHKNDKSTSEQDISHLAYHHCNTANQPVDGRITYIRQFAKKACYYVKNGKSANSVTGYYTALQTYIRYCDNQSVSPFTKEGYLSYFGNDGELQHQTKIYSPSLRIWQRNDGDEIGIKESSATAILSMTVTALTWCGLDAQSWKHLHRPFASVKEPYQAYSEMDENMIVSRLSDLFFGLATQLIALKNDGVQVPRELPASINFWGTHKILLFPTTLKTYKGKVNASSAFNITMGAAYHLFCYFTSLNDCVVREVCHPLKIEVDSRDKSLKKMKVIGFKVRSNQEVNALLTDEISSDNIIFDVEKKTGIAFIEILSELSTCYGSNQELLFTLDEDEQISDSFAIKNINSHLVSQLNLVTSHRSLNLPWFSELFYTFAQGNAIELKAIRNGMERRIVSKIIYPIDKTAKTRNTLNISYCLLSCFTDKPLKKILLPLTYSGKDKDGNVKICFTYQDGKQDSFDVPILYLQQIKDIESWATARADAQPKALPRFLLKVGSRDYARLWDGINPLSSTFIKLIGVEPNDYFVTLQSSRFRKTTSSQEYRDGHLSHLKHLLQNTLTTLEKHYINGHPETNNLILSQAIQVVERIATGHTLEHAKVQVKEKLGIDILTHDEWLKNKVITNPNGITCDGKHNLHESKNTQRATNKVMQQDLPCSEFDMCYKCKSAKAIDEPNAIYKLISFIDVLKEALDRQPNAGRDVQNKIETFEYTLEGASTDVLKEAMQQFNQKGRHPRVTMNHALLSIYR